MAEILRPVRKLRHWKQQFDANARFIWRKDVQWSEETFLAGEIVRDDILEEMGRAKLRRFWESHMVELADFSDELGRLVEPTATEEATSTAPPPGGAPEEPKVELPEGVELEKLRGSWWRVKLGDVEKKIRGEANARKLVETLVAERASAAEPEPQPQPEPDGSDQQAPQEPAGAADPEIEGGQSGESTTMELGALGDVTVADGGDGWFDVTIAGEQTRVRGEEGVAALIEDAIAAKEGAQ